MKIKKFLPHIVAILTFLAVSMLYFKPQYEGLVLHQSDMVQVGAMSRDIQAHIATEGEHPQWSGRMFGGMPSYLHDFNYEGRLIKEAAGPLWFIGTPAAYLFLAMLGFWVMLLCFRVNPWLAGLGGIAYGLSTYFVIIIGVGHLTKMIALCYAPPLVGAVWLAYRRRRWAGAILAGVFAALEISASHPQITYYFLFVLLALAISEAVRAVRKKLVPAFLKTTGALLLAGMLAVGANLIQLYFIQDYAKATMRGGSELTESKGLDKAYATEWSYGQLETFDLFIPNLMGGSSTHGFRADGPVFEALTNDYARRIAQEYDMSPTDPTVRQYATEYARQNAPHLPGYWGGQSSTAGPVYIGAVVIFLFVLGMFILGGYTKWWLFGATVLCILLAWGHNLMWFSEFFFDFVPYYNKFRTVSMILVIAEFALPLLGILALQKLWNGDLPKQKVKRSLQYTLYITGGIALFFTLLGPSLFSFTNATDTAMGLSGEVIAAMQTERASLLRTDAFRTLIFVVLSAATVWAFYKGKIKKSVLITAFAALILVDMIGVDLRQVSHDSFVPKQQVTHVQPTPADQQILSDPEPGFRVANFTLYPFADAMTSYFHRSVGGYHAAKMQRYQDLIDHHLYRQVRDEQGNPEVVHNWAVYDMLNTKYFITPDERGAPTAQLNPGAMGAAWFVQELAYVPDARAEIAALDDFDPGHTAFVDERFRDIAGNPGLLATDSTAVITLTEYKVNHQTYKYSAAAPQLAVFSEIYYPSGWTAYLDGEETPYFRADYVLRAMRLPAGDHTVEFRFAAPHFATLKAITMASSAILLAGLVLVLVLAVVCRRKKEIE